MSKLEASAYLSAVKCFSDLVPDAADCVDSNKKSLYVITDIEHNNTGSVVLIQSANSDDFLIKYSMAWAEVDLWLLEEVYTFSAEISATTYRGKKAEPLLTLPYKTAKKS